MIELKLIYYLSRTFNVSTQGCQSTRSVALNSILFFYAYVLVPVNTLIKAITQLYSFNIRGIKILYNYDNWAIWLII